MESDVMVAESAYRVFLIHQPDGTPVYTTVVSQEAHNIAIETELDFLRTKVEILENRINELTDSAAIEKLKTRMCD